MVDTELLRERMKRCGYTQKEMAKRLGITQPNLSQKINNKRRLSIDQMIEMSEALGIKPSEYRRFFKPCDNDSLRKSVSETI